LGEDSRPAGGTVSPATMSVGLYIFSWFPRSVYCPWMPRKGNQLFGDCGYPVFYLGPALRAATLRGSLRSAGSYRRRLLAALAPLHIARPGGGWRGFCRLPPSFRWVSPIALLFCPFGAFFFVFTTQSSFRPKRSAGRNLPGCSTLADTTYRHSRRSETC
jgi:hypothetical protein